jgi:hypothetical protein
LLFYLVRFEIGIFLVIENTPYDEMEIILLRIVLWAERLLYSDACMRLDDDASRIDG